MTKLYLANYGPTKFTGVLRCITDLYSPVDPQVMENEDGSLRVIPAGERGASAYAIDVLCTLQSGEGKEIELNDLKPVSTWNRDPITADSISNIGLPSISGVHLSLQKVTESGAGYVVHFQSKVHKMLQADLWLTFYPQHSEHSYGELLLTASDPSVPDYFIGIDRPLVFEWLGLHVKFDGLDNNRLIEKGDVFADGQARAFSFSAIRMAALNNAQSYANAGLLLERLVHAQAVQNLWPNGGFPVFQQDASLWVKMNVGETRNALGKWNAPRVGVNARSADTGKQEDQLFKGGECFRFPGAILPRYFAALSQAKRPCHHLEADGGHLDLFGHPKLVMWDSRPHWHTGVSPDRLGKSGNPNSTTAHGWWGPDEEHLLISTLFVTARLVDSPAVQRILEHHAVDFYFQKTVAANVSTSRPGAARAMGYEGYAAWCMWHAMNNRVLADRMLLRAFERVRLVHLPFLRKLTRPVWDMRKDDPRLGTGEWWMPWQQAVGVWGLMKLAELMRHRATLSREAEELLQFCKAGAQEVVDKAYHLDNGTWRALYALSTDGRNNPSDYATFGCPLAVATLLHLGSVDPKVRDIWDQCLAFSDQSWIDPTLNKRS